MPFSPLIWEKGTSDTPFRVVPDERPEDLPSPRGEDVAAMATDEGVLRSRSFKNARWFSEVKVDPVPASAYRCVQQAALYCPSPRGEDVAVTATDEGVLQ
jgi:hypothetical protein